MLTREQLHNIFFDFFMWLVHKKECQSNFHTVTEKIDNIKFVRF